MNLLAAKNSLANQKLTFNLTLKNFSFFLPFVFS